jgi:hypothetical protein
MTRLQLVTAIKREARIKNSSNLDVMIGNILDDVTTDYCNRQQYFELRKTDVDVPLTDSIGQYDLPADFNTIAEVRYAIENANFNNYRVLKPKTATIKRTSSNGWPFYFFLTQGFQINIFPFNAVSSGDSMLLDYFITPLSIFSADSDEFPVPRLQSAVKKEVIMRLEKFHNDNAGAQMVSQDATSSYQAGQAGGSNS